jgi:hypothetical protein
MRISFTGRTPKILRFPGDDGTNRAISEVGDHYDHGNDSLKHFFAVRPRIGLGSQLPPSQLVTLWALLFGLSSLARYHPALWVQALDPDSSELAVPLEDGLDVALERAPALLYDAIKGGPWVAAAVRDQLAALKDSNTNPPSTEENA